MSVQIPTLTSIVQPPVLISLFFLFIFCALILFELICLCIYCAEFTINFSVFYIYSVIGFYLVYSYLLNTLNIYL